MLDTLFQSLFESAPDAMILVTNEGKIALVNQQTEKIFGYAAVELVGQEVEVLLPDQLAQAHRNYRNHFSKEPKVRAMGQGKELLGKRKDGTEFFVEISLSPLTFEGSMYISAAIRDITARKKAEKKFRDLLESAPDAMIIVNKRGNIELANTQAEKLLGYTKEEIVGLPVESIIPTRFTQSHYHYREEYFREPKTREMGVGLELFVLSKTGNEIPVEVSLSPLETEDSILVSAAIRDISKRKAIEARLKVSENRFRSVTEHALDSIITLTHDGIILTYNKISEQMFGYPLREAVGEDCHKLFINFDLVSCFEESPQQETSRSLRKNILGKHKNGEQFLAEISLTEMLLEKEKIYILITRDASERELLDRLKNQFVATVSHELRTPLTSIKGAIDLLLAGKAGSINIEAMRLLEIASRNSERLATLINHILDMEKLEAGKMKYTLQMVEVPSLIKQVIELQQPYADKFSIKLLFQDFLSADNRFVYADAERLTQVFTHLISNAIKFSPREESVFIRVQANNQKIRVTIEDRGPGIPHEFKNKLFQRFSQIDSSDKKIANGAGLGLYLAKMIVDQLGGEIGLSSHPGRGSTFYVELKTQAS